MFKKINISNTLLILLAALILVIIWFYHGNLLGSGESGLLFYNVNTQLNLLRWAWSQGGLGLNIGITSASTPTYIFLALLENLGLKGYLLQALVFYILFVAAGLGIFYFTKKIFPNLPSKYCLLTVIFYWFNPISLIGVWNRFLYNYMFFWSAIPLIMLLLYLLLQERKWLFVFLLELAFSFFSYISSGIPFILLSWLIICFSFIFYFVLADKDKRLFYLKSFLVLLVFYTLTNFWWITQLFSFSASSDFTSTISLFFNTNGNLSGLTTLSYVLGMMSYTLRFFHSSFIESGPVWARVYSLNFLVIFEYLPSLVILWVIYRCRRVKEVIFLGLLFFLTLFLMKGNQPPFGEVFQFFFVKFSFVQVFRNPFEKFGFLLPLAAAPLFAYGLKNLVDSVSNNLLKKVFFIVPVLVVVVFWGFPFWTGLVFTSSNDRDVNLLRSYQVKVPSYYKQANDWLNTQGSDFRFISFPLGGEGMTYTWDQPYSGVELSSTLFDIPNISFNTSIPYYSEIASELEKYLLTGNKFLDLLSILNVKFLVLRDDVDWKTRALRDPQILKTELDQDLGLRQVSSFGKITIYQVPDDKFQQKIYISKRNVKVEPDLRISDFPLAGGSRGDAIYTGDENRILPNTDTILINPVQTNFYQKEDNFNVSDALSRLLYSRYLPDNPIYHFIQLKEWIDKRLTTYNSQDQFIYDLTHLGKRTVEIYNLVAKNSNQTYIDQTVESYVKDLDWIEAEYPDKFADDPSNGFRKVSQEEFSKQLIVLSSARSKTVGSSKIQLEKAVSRLNEDMLKFGFVSLNLPLLNSQNTRYWVYRYHVEKDGEYSLVMDSNQFKDFYGSQTDIEIQVDGDLAKRHLIFEDNIIKLGSIFLTKGVHEIMISDPESMNLVHADKEIDLESKDNPNVQLQVAPFDPFSSYFISYDYWIKKGGIFHLIANYDNDNSVQANNEPSYIKTVHNDGYNHDFIHEEVYVTPKNGSSKLNLGFLVDPYSNCLQDRTLFSQSCDNKDYKKQFDKDTEVIIKNMVVKRVFSSKVYLLQNIPIQPKPTPVAHFSKISPVEYKISVSNVQEPYLLVFSDRFSSGWKIKINDQNYINDKNHILVNAYSNGWLVDKTGDYTLTLEFSSQSLLQIGEKVSIISTLFIIISSSMWFFLKKR